jgi:outer membrane protein OmpA-like peptidoglycan-associated protein
VRRIVSCLLSLPLITSCAGNQGPSRELLNARNEYARATRSNAPTDAPRSLENARVTLRAAEEAHRDDPGSPYERELAFVAMRRAQAAIADANARAAQRDAQLARDELKRTTVDTARAAELSKAQAEAARAQANAASQQAQTEAQRRMAAEQSAEAARESLDQVEGELAGIRDQLARQGNALDEQTKQLKEREAALQAQLETMRAQREQTLEAMRKLGDVAEEDRGLVLTLPGEVMFRTGQATLLPRAREKLDTLAEALQQIDTDQRFVIEGHTDSVGSDRTNERLSRQRAAAVRTYLIRQGVDADRIEAVGRGEEEPVASNANPEGRANNRRVEIVVSPPAVTRR